MTENDQTSMRRCDSRSLTDQGLIKYNCSTKISVCFCTSKYKVLLSRRFLHRCLPGKRLMWTVVF